MPPTRRRRSGNTNASNQQSTLSFKGAQSRITKPTATPHSAKDSAVSKPSQLETTTSTPKFSTAKDLLRTAREGYTIPPAGSDTAPASASVSPSSEEERESPELSPETKTLPHHPSKQQQQRGEPKHPLTPTESKALALTPNDLENYWSSLQSARKAPRVHQTSTSTHEKILRHFDLSSEYGPCIGVSRMDRWKRAEKLGLEPRVEVLGVLLRDEGGEMSRSRFDELIA